MRLPESDALPPTPAESETSHNPAVSEPSIADPASDGAPSSQPLEKPTQESSNVRRRVSKKGAATVAEQGSIAGLRSDDPEPPAPQETEAEASSSAPPVRESEPEVGKTKWGDLPDDPPDSFNTVELETAPMTNPAPSPAKKPSTPAVSVVAVESKPAASGKFLLEPDQPSEWPKREPVVKLPMWNKKDSFIEKFLNHKVVIAHCPTGSGKSTILPALAAMNLHPKAGRVCCTQIRRATTQAVCRNTKDVWGLEEDSEIVGFRHGTEKSNDGADQIPRSCSLRKESS